MQSLYGLVTSTAEPIPLHGVKVEGDILGRAARVRVTQRFKNQETEAVEAVYRFPLPEAAAVSGFKARIDGRVITGKVEEREKAFEIYDKAIAGGHGGYLLDQERPNIFTLSVGNLKPGSEAVIEIEFVTLLDVEGSRIRFCLPTAISPRYVPKGMPDKDGVPETDRIHPTYAPDVPYGLSISIDIHDGREVAALESPSHAIQVDLARDPVRVQFSARSVKMDRDFILYVTPRERESASRAYRVRTDDGTFLQLDLLVSAGEDGSEMESHPGKSRGRALAGPGKAGRRTNRDPRREIIFLLDCSGSMTGDSIKEAKRALEICLKGMEMGTVFNLCRFGSTHEFLFEKPAVYTSRTCQRALKYLEGTDADLGGTEVLSPLKAICAHEPGKLSRGRDIVLITDGEVGNEAQVIGLVESHNPTTRVFALGIGAGPNEHLVKGLARAGRGRASFIFPGERIEPKVLSVFGDLMQPVLDHPVISWGGRSAEQAPDLPTIFLDRPITIFARCSDGALSRGKVTLKGKIDGRERRWEIQVVDADPKGLSVPVLWARERIRDLESDGPAAVRGSGQAERKLGRRNKEIVAISKQYGLISGLTSFVAVEERKQKDKATGKIVVRKVPTLVTVGWHGMGGLLGRRGGARPSLTHFMMSSPEDSSWDRFCSDSFNIGIPPKHPPTLERVRMLTKLSRPRRLSAEERRAERRTDLLTGILTFQRADGGFELNGAVLTSLGIKLEDLESIAKTIKASGRVNRLRVLCTALVMKVLALHFGAERSRWNGVTGKSQTWLRKVVVDSRPMIGKQGILDWAEEFAAKQVKIKW
jgi:Ca-activated chloride channel homolog